MENVEVLKKRKKVFRKKQQNVKKNIEELKSGKKVFRKKQQNGKKALKY